MAAMKHARRDDEVTWCGAPANGPDVWANDDPMDDMCASCMSALRDACYEKSGLSALAHESRRLRRIARVRSLLKP